MSSLPERAVFIEREGLISSKFIFFFIAFWGFEGVQRKNDSNSSSLVLVALAMFVGS